MIEAERQQVVAQRKTIAVLISTMRAGSTLLKALLAEASDVSNLTETNFQVFQDERTARRRIEALSDEPIVLLKRPGWYNEIFRYPTLPRVAEAKKIVLVRDAYETILSLRKMTFGRFRSWIGTTADRALLAYWIRITGAIVQQADSDPNGTRLVRYEDLVADPIKVTASLFQYLGSEQRQGVDCYSKPVNYEWRWGKDDGGPKIGQLKVIAPPPTEYADKKLLRTILKADLATKLRQRLGYCELPRA